ncbi:hypothetical protein [Streptomyces sp. NPDC088727]|uniref:hypothetical protein n=1 Tax=Streptomyces sp. NPDC088727 TaxID=3365875 RepID=UPI0038168E95
MTMSDSERRLLLSGTLDTSGVGAGADEDLRNVALAFQEAVAPDGTKEPIYAAKSTADELRDATELSEDDKDAPCKTCRGAWSKNHVCPPPAPLVDRPKVPVKRTAKKTTASKPQAPKPAES